MTAASRDQRRHTRVQVDVAIEVLRDGGRSARGAVLDLSMRGLFVVGVKLERGTPVRFGLFLGEDELPLVRGEAEVVRAGPEGSALHITGLDLSSFAHLKRLVMLNAERPALVEREIVTLVDE